ncbi:hypothetical protein SAY87_007016 [Trapa incisa]|uniref:Uncharacterized protein n=1 Tax=Trapa incisa TaxID=236973 RepID=A0AAN7Q0H2_9MYRT|nr:hypothetical protein SAY87_007016 [Trapa incisa]
MSMASLQGAKLFELWGKVSSNHCEVGRTVWCASWTMSSEPKPAHMKKTEGLSLRVGHPPAPQFNRQRSLSLSFNRLKPPEKDLVQKERHEFGQFIAREALLNEEYWVGSIMIFSSWFYYLTSILLLFQCWALWPCSYYRLQHGFGQRVTGRTDQMRGEH